jgi:hypothetical protein
MDPFLTTETANFYRRYSEFTTPLPPPIAELAPGNLYWIQSVADLRRR